MAVVLIALIIVASVLVIASGIWVAIGLVAALTTPKPEPSVPDESARDQRA